jgi:hypothetical protein
MSCDRPRSQSSFKCEGLGGGCDLKRSGASFFGGKGEGITVTNVEFRPGWLFEPERSLPGEIFGNWGGP